MPLPDIQLPAELPRWLAAPHEHTEEPLYGHAPTATGMSRTRRIRTAVLRRVRAQLALNDSQLATFADWFENTLRAGLLRFACPVQAFGASVVWYDAQITGWSSAPDQRQLYSIVEVDLLLRGDASATAPELLTASDLSTIALRGSAELVIETSVSDLTQVALLGGIGDGSAADLTEIELLGIVSTSAGGDELLRVWMGLDSTLGALENDEAHLAHIMGL